MKSSQPRRLSLSLLFITIASGAMACAPEDDESTEPVSEASSDQLRIGGLGADGDSCSIDRDGLKIPGTKKGLDCCNVFDPTDCVTILKPFPGVYSIRR